MNEITLYQLLDLMEQGDEDTSMLEIKATVVSKNEYKYRAHAYWDKKEQKLIIELRIY